MTCTLRMTTVTLGELLHSQALFPGGSGHTHKGGLIAKSQQTTSVPGEGCDCDRKRTEAAERSKEPCSTATNRQSHSSRHLSPVRRSGGLFSRPSASNLAIHRQARSIFKAGADSERRVSSRSPQCIQCAEKHRIRNLRRPGDRIPARPCVSIGTFERRRSNSRRQDSMLRYHWPFCPFSLLIGTRFLASSRRIHLLQPQRHFNRSPEPRRPAIRKYICRD